MLNIDFIISESESQRNYSKILIGNGSNAVSVTKFLQGFIENEVVLNAEGSCALTCADYRKSVVSQCFPGSICETNRQRTCNGVLRNCHGISDNLDICVAEPNGTRRYNWARLDNGNKIGPRDGECSREFNVRIADSFILNVFIHKTLCSTGKIMDSLVRQMQ